MYNTILKLSLILSSVFAFATTAKADDRLYIEDFDIAIGETKEVAILMDNALAYTAFQVDIYLPDGLTATNAVTLTDRKNSDHTIAVEHLEDGAIRLVSYSLSLGTYSGNSGAIATFAVTANINAKGSNLITLKNGMLIDTVPVKYMLAETSATVSGPEMLPIVIQDSEKGTITTSAIEGENVSFKFEPTETWTINSIAINGVDVTSSLNTDGSYTIDAISEATTINISYSDGSTALQSVATSDMKAYGYNGNILVSGVEHGKHIDIYGIDGVLLRSVVSTGDIMSINLPSDAVYIVKSQDSTTKVRL